MKELHKMSTSALKQERENLSAKIADYEKYLSAVRSQIVSLLYQSMIQKWKERDRAIKAELKSRGELEG